MFLGEYALDPIHWRIGEPGLAQGGKILADNALPELSALHHSRTFLLRRSGQEPIDDREQYKQRQADAEAPSNELLLDGQERLRLGIR
jgi:hypothetical protein